VRRLLHVEQLVKDVRADGQHAMITAVRGNRGWALSILATAIVSLIAPNAPAAAGDILRADVQPDGWTLFVWVEGMTTGGLYDLGWSSNNVVTAGNKLVLTIDSIGYDDRCEGVTNTRTLYGTKQLRVPASTNWDDVAAGTNVLLKFALSDYVYETDRRATLRVGAGLYHANNRTNAARSGIIVDNRSLVRSPKVIANWSDVPYQRISGGSYSLRCIAFHRSGQNGRPVRAVKFWSCDTHGHTSGPVVVTAPAIDAAWGDQTPVIEYTATMSAASLVQGDVVYNYFAAYPWVGGADSVTDCSDGVNDSRSMQYNPLQMICDRSGAYGASYAVVDPTNGVVEGLVTTNFADITNGQAKAFNAINVALDAVAAKNLSAFGRKDWGNSTIFLKKGSHTWMGCAVNDIEPMSTWVTITRHPLASRDQVVLEYAKVVGLNFQTSKPRFYDVTVDWPHAGPFVSSLDTVWFDRVHIKTNVTSSQAVIAYSARAWITRCLVDEQRSTFRITGDPELNHWFLRGNKFTQSIHVNPHVLLGNLLLPEAACELVLGNENSGNAINPWIVAFNRFYRIVNIEGISFGRAAPVLQGGAFVQNLAEVSSAPYGMPLGSLSTGSTNAVSPMKHVICWHNTLVGQRWLDQYNDYGALSIRSELYSHKNNVYDDYNTKHDMLMPANAARTNRWSVMYQVGGSGNVMAELASGDFSPEAPAALQGSEGFNGVSSHHSETNRPDRYFRWKNPKCWTGSGSGAGSGDYHPLPGSPALGRVADLVLPYDIEGTPRRVGGAAGAYECASGVPDSPHNLRVP
jgi:hypothetical protein